jgi:hypothetical protein
VNSPPPPQHHFDSSVPHTHHGPYVFTSAHHHHYHCVPINFFLLSLCAHRSLPHYAAPCSSFGFHYRLIPQLCHHHSNFH